METSPVPVQPADLNGRLSELMVRDAHRLRGRFAGTRKVRDPEARQATLDEIGKDVGVARERVAYRANSVPRIR